MKVAVTGASGQLGRALLASTPSGVEAVGLRHADLDITDADAVNRRLGEIRPDCVINTAAFTDVDGSEDKADAARQCNSEGPANLAIACARQQARLVHLSTDFVFDGNLARPYLPQDAPAPLGVYAASKLEGEQRVRQELPAGACILRTSWLYGERGNNFVLRMLELMRTRKELKVVLDQVGAPTWTHSLAPVAWMFALRAEAGVFHWCDSGLASRYDFAMAIAEEAAELELIEAAPAIWPITSAEYPLRARRPAYSVLDKRATETALGLRAEHWRVNLRRMLASMTADWE